jgi:cellobiose phosphorylase
MGLALLANLAAYDFGFITAGQLIERTANALGTMQRLERFRGHFYNWYDTRTLKPLPQLYVSSVDSGNLAMHLLTLRQGLLALRADAGVSAGAQSLAQQAGELARMEYDFLFDAERRLLAIGYNVTESRLDAAYYDLLASEARAVSFVAIAQGALPQESWFALGRLLTSAGGETALLSWSGSMFEYLMPLLVMPAYEDTLLDQTCRAAVARQIAYGSQRGVPWGMSESGYNRVDAGANYQYRAFGVPGLGLKRGLSEDLVIAPYASALALMVAPEAACVNLERLAAEGLEGELGFYEAVDYTPSRLPRGQDSAVVRSYMAHHQGMILLSLAHLLLGQPMQQRFAADATFQATLLLLQERIPKRVALQLSTAGRFDTRAVSGGPETPVRVLADPDSAVPQVQLLSNGRYHVMVTHAGGGYSRWKELAVTRWREDTTCDNWGSFCYLRDVASGKFWSSAHQPALKRAEAYEAIFSEGRAEFRRRDHGYDVHTEIVVSPEDDIELRRLRITNRAQTRRTVEVTSYAEVVLALPAADALHPAFSNLFVQTEIAAEGRAILCTRRPRSLGEQAPWMFHAMAVHGAECSELSYETDRARFIGRGRSVAAPQAMQEAVLSGSQGSVLDPIVAIRQRITLAPGQSATIDMVSGIGESREAALHLAGKYQDRNLADRVLDLAWTHSLVTLRQINATESDAQLYGRLAGSVLYANASLRGETGVLAKNRRGQSSLWGYGISGDLPIVLLQISDAASIDLVRQLVQAHAYWRLKGLAVDLMIWNEDHAGYRQVLQDQIMGLIAAGIEAHVVDRPGGIFVRRAEQIADEDRILFQSVARVVLSDRQGSLAEQIDRQVAPAVKMARLKPTRTDKGEARAFAAPPPQRDLMFFNGLGGFARDGHEYVITTAPGQVTPAPWVNVLANPQFGSVISESGLSYTWSENAHESRLTPWGNDPVSDASGEAFYLRDEENGQFWSPSPLPCRGEGPYVTRHGFGYSVFEHAEGGIRSELKVYVDLEVAVKYSVLKIANESGRARRLSATGYVEWVLGDLRPKTAMHVVTEIDPASGALCARNPYSAELAERVAFFDVDDASRSLTGDRSEFLGRNGTLGNPAALRRAQLSNRVGAAYDPCGAIQVPFELAAGQERELIFRLGVGGRRSSEDAGKLARRLRGTAAARGALERVQAYWARTLGAVQVETPDASLDVLVNGWLVYQTLACRLWARSGYYQSGGAFGFRDQLQDSMALLHAEPALAREQLLRAASRQFVEGDVQHWWHPPSGRGVRTHCSDDFLWLPAAACRYVLASGDAAVLAEPVGFLEGRPVNPEDDSYYDLPARSGESATLYQHCVRALLRGLRFGEHGLPLIGSGDWNDGMNMVGAGGKGESVWLGFFLYQVLLQFADLARGRGDAALAERCRSEAETLRRNLEQHGWDGAWYRRAYFDDGTPLGSAANAECQIDSIAQSWSVLSGAGDAARSRKAMQSLDERLVRREQRLVQLLEPPFDTSALNPGYIKGYVPGVRENGGQYTHAAIWAAMAFAEMGDHKRAWELAAMINPVNHASSAEAMALYKVEPYAVAADVYAVAPHTGRGGWTWYTGSAGWMYRLMVESLLGVRREGDRLRIAPCLPANWPGFKLRYRYGNTVYDIQVRNGGAEGSAQGDHTIALVDDGQAHRIDIQIGVRARLTGTS